jgi:hypothetical protein
MNELKEIIVEGTVKTPRIEFNHLSGDLILQGRSFPEDAESVYEPLMAWINEYVKMPCNTTNLHLKLEYFNSASLLWIVEFIRGLSKIDKEESSLYIHLYSEGANFDIRDMNEFKDVICSVFENIGKLKIKAGIKIHGTDSDGKVVVDTTIIT